MVGWTPPDATGRSPPPLVDHLNRPIDFGVLKHAISAPSLSTMRSVYTSAVSRDMNPRKLAAILRGAESGDVLSYLELAEQMEEKDLHYLSVLGTRKRAVSQLDIEVEDADESPEAKACGDLLRDWLKRETLQPELFDVLDAVGKGYSMSEIVWEMSAKEWRPATLSWTDPRFFRLDMVDLRTPLLYVDGGQYEMAPPFKFVSHVHPSKSGLPIRSGLARPAAWAWMFKNYSMKDWVAFAEVYGLPIRVGKYGPGATDDERAILLRGVQSIGSDAAAIIPDSMTIEFIESKSGQSDGALFRELADFCDQQMSKAVLGQTATTDAIAGGHAVGREHQLVRDDIKQADAVLIQSTLNRDIARPMVMLNRGPQEAYPRFRVKTPDWVDIQAVANAVGTLAPYGLRVKQAELRQKFGLTDPDEGDEVLNAGAPAALDSGEVGQGPGAPPPPGVRRPAQIKPRADGKDPIKDATPTPATALVAQASGGGGVAASYALSNPLKPQTGSGGLDELTEASLDEWEPLAAAVAAPIEQLLTNASSLEEVRDGLAAVIAAMDPTATAELMARAGFAARIAGLVGMAPNGNGGGS
jgi:phage gp29-like protein